MPEGTWPSEGVAPSEFGGLPFPDDREGFREIAHHVTEEGEKTFAERLQAVERYEQIPAEKVDRIRLR